MPPKRSRASAVEPLDERLPALRCASPPSRKATIPKALREQVWVLHMGHAFEGKCPISWCKNRINVFDFHVGHNIPEARGGSLTIINLRPLCARCNTSMGSHYTIDEWQKLGDPGGVESVGSPGKWRCC